MGPRRANRRTQVAQVEEKKDDFEDLPGLLDNSDSEDDEDAEDDNGSSNHSRSSNGNRSGGVQGS